MKRFPILSIASGVVVAVTLMLVALSSWNPPPTALAALGILPLAAAIADAVRLRRRDGGAGQGSETEIAPPAELDESELREWLEEKIGALTAREQAIQTRAIALQQWMQFPDAIEFDTKSLGPKSAEKASDDNKDPLARHDRELFDLIEAKTKLLFENIRQDAYRTQEDDGKKFDTQRIRNDLVELVSDVAAIYRPDDESPLLRTNLEAISRATGRASLRFLVAIENLPIDLTGYDFQTIYNTVARAVSTYGMYKAAKPYIDVASNMLLAGRVVSSTNPITLAAWWAAGKAATYGATKLGQHIVDQQAVGLIRQLVEIVALEVASLYSPMVRYRDIHWIYGVELVQLASELSLAPPARLEVLKQLASIAVKDEYGRVSLMRQAATGKSSRPDQYHPAQSLSSAERMAVAERLEAFLLGHVLNAPNEKPDQASLDRWQSAASERLDIQFRTSEVTASHEEQVERCVWALASFALEHLGDEPDDVVHRLSTTKCWMSRDTHAHNDWIRHLQSDPPFLYHSPRIDPETPLCGDFLDDLIALAAADRKPSEAASSLSVGETTVKRWTGDDALQVTAYFLRTDPKAYYERYCQLKAKRLLPDRDQGSPARSQPGVLDALEFLANGAQVQSIFGEATFQTPDPSAIKDVFVANIDSTLVCFSLAHSNDSLSLTVHAACQQSRVTSEKIAGYLRSDCRLQLPGDQNVVIPGSSLRGYDSYFAPLLGK